MDTHGFVKRLMESGFTEEQAEVLVEEQVHLLSNNLATKSDLGAFKSDLDALRADFDVLRADFGALRADLGAFKSDLDALRADFDVLRAEVKTEISNAQVETIKWMAGMLIVQFAAIIGLVKLL